MPTTDNSHLKMRLAEANMDSQKMMKASFDMPEIDSTFESLGLKDLEVVLPDTWKNVSSIVAEAV